MPARQANCGARRTVGGRGGRVDISFPLPHGDSDMPFAFKGLRVYTASVVAIGEQFPLTEAGEW